MKTREELEAMKQECTRLWKKYYEIKEPHEIAWCKANREYERELMRFEIAEELRKEQEVVSAN